MALLATTFLTASEEGEARPRYRTRTKKVAQGVVFTRILDRKGPKRIKILEIDPTAPLTLDVALADGRIPGLQTTSSIAAEHGAIAAVNGTYFLPSGRPVGVFVEDAEFVSTPLVAGNAFGMTADAEQTYIGKPKTRVNSYRPAYAEEHRIHGWNEGTPQLGQIGGFSVLGGSAYKPPKHACSARLQPSSEVMWGSDGTGFEGDYVVEKTKCDRSRLRRGGGVVISAPMQSEEAPTIASYFPGETARLSWSLGWPQVLDAMAGNPVLVENGVNVGYKCGSDFCKKQPRTGIGVTAEGKILLVTVDGRQKEYSIGMNLLQFGRLFEQLGAVRALNLDGGGSTTMVVDGKVKNRPSDSAERAVGSALVLLGGADVEQAEPQPYSEPTSAPPPPPIPTPSSSPTPVDLPPALSARVGLDGFAVAGLDVTSVLSDPGSTGGLLEAIGAGNVPGAGPLPRSLRWVVRAFTQHPLGRVRLLPK